MPGVSQDHQAGDLTFCVTALAAVWRRGWSRQEWKLLTELSCFGQSRGFVGGGGNDELRCGCAESEMHGHLEGDRWEVCVLGV